MKENCIMTFERWGALRPGVLCVALAASAVLAWGGSARAVMVTYNTAPGATAGGQPVDVTATFSTQAGQVVITVTDLQNNPTSDIQTLNGISFSLSTGQTVASSFTEQAILRTVTGNGAGQYSDVGTPTTLVSAPDKWNLNNSTGLGIEITSIGNSGGHGTLIGGPDGSNAYAAANSSITNSNHNPFAAGTATFTLNIAGVTSSSTISAARFEFGTAAGTNLPGQPGQPQASPVPEPSVLALSCVLGVAALGYRWKTRKPRAA